MFQRHVISLAVALLLLTACNRQQPDSLATERASMEAEAKALAHHKAAPASEIQRSGPDLTKESAAAAGSRALAGTRIKVVTTTSLSTRSANTGDEWAGTLLEDLKDAGGKVLAKAGSEVKGRVVLASDGTNLRRKHELEVRLYRLQSASGAPVDVHTTSVTREGGDGGQRPAILESQSQLEFQLTSAIAFP